MKKLTLGDVFKKASSNIAQKNLKDRTGIYPIYGASGLIKQVDFYQQDKEYIAVVKDGAGIGRTMLLPAYSSVIGTMQYLLPKEEYSVDIKYLFYAIEHMNLAKYYSGATIPHIYFKDYQKEPINIPDIDTQKEISQIFDKIAALIASRKEQLNRLDQIVKSRFIEMFGDPGINQMNWQKINISNVVDGKVSNGFFAKRDQYCDDGNVNILGVVNIVNRMYSCIEGLPRTNGTDKDIEKYGVKYGDMLFCRSSLVAEGIGKASIVPKGTPNNVLFECHVIRLPLDLNRCVPEFMQVLSTTEFFRNQVISQSKTATMTTIGQDGILKTEIILPPFDLQNQFADFVAQVDKSKLVEQRGLAQWERLLHSKQNVLIT